MRQWGKSLHNIYSTLHLLHTWLWGSIKTYKYFDRLFLCRCLLVFDVHFFIQRADRMLVVPSHRYNSNTTQIQLNTNTIELNSTLQKHLLLPSYSCIRAWFELLSIFWMVASHAKCDCIAWEKRAFLAFHLGFFRNFFCISLHLENYHHIMLGLGTM